MSQDYNAMFEADSVYDTSTKIVSDEYANHNYEVELYHTINFIKSVNPDFDSKIAKSFFYIAPIYKINPIMAISQSIIDTNYFSFINSNIQPEQHNYCKLEAINGDTNGANFETIEDGIHAQCQHLYAYGCTDDLPDGVIKIDPRFDLITRGCSEDWEHLTGKWAIPGYDFNLYNSFDNAVEASATYGQLILNMYYMIEASVVGVGLEVHYDVTEDKTNDNNVDIYDEANNNNDDNHSVNCDVNNTQNDAESINKLNDFGYEDTNTDGNDNTNDDDKIKSKHVKHKIANNIKEKESVNTNTENNTNTSSTQSIDMYKSVGLDDLYTHDVFSQYDISTTVIKDKKEDRDKNYDMNLGEYDELSPNSPNCISTKTSKVLIIYDKIVSFIRRILERIFN